MKKEIQREAILTFQKELLASSKVFMWPHINGVCGVVLKRLELDPLTDAELLDESPQQVTDNEQG